MNTRKIHHSVVDAGIQDNSAIFSDPHAEGAWVDKGLRLWIGLESFGRNQEPESTFARVECFQVTTRNART